MRRECGLCGEPGELVRPSVVRWDDGSFEAVNRCTDRDACRQRLEARREPWPVVDGHDLEAAIRRRTA